MQPADSKRLKNVNEIPAAVDLNQLGYMPNSDGLSDRNAVLFDAVAKRFASH